jgi:hypothetical protein
MFINSIQTILFYNPHRVRNSEKLRKSSEKALSGQEFIIPSNPTKHVSSSCYLSRSEVRKDKVSKEFEAVYSQIKVFNEVSRRRNITTLLAYLQGHTVGYSFFRKTKTLG